MLPAKLILRRSWLLMALWVACCTGRAGAGGIEYPALGHFDPQEGTLEVWFAPMVDDLHPAVKEKEYRGGFALFAMSVPEQFSFGGGWGSKAKQHGIFISMQAPGREKALLSVIGPTAERWNKGETHRVAFTWKDRDMRVFLDGREAGRRSQAQPLGGKMAGQSLCIGSRENRDTLIIVQAVRLSSIARPEKMLVDAAPVPDIYTTLLDRFDQPGAEPSGPRTRPAQWNGLAGDEGGLFQGNWSRVDAPQRGIALYKQRTPATGKGSR